VRIDFARACVSDSGNGGAGEGRRRRKGRDGGGEEGERKEVWGKRPVDVVVTQLK